MRWQDEKTLQDVELREDSRPDTGFLSWSNYIKKHREQASKRYEVAQQFLPWPLGFKESVLALRAIIRDKKKANEDYQSELLSLYELAAWESFCPKQCDNLQQPGFKVFDQIPGGLVIALPIDYQQLGYKQLKLVTKTDAKMLVSIYGEPKQHSTLNQLFQPLWQQAERDYLARLQQPQNETDEPQTKVNKLTQSKSTATKTEDQKQQADIDTKNESVQTPNPRFKSGLATASKKYDTNGKVISSSRLAQRKSKDYLNDKTEASRSADQQKKENPSKYFNKIEKTKQLSQLVIQALKDRALIKEKVFGGSLQPIKQILAKKRVIALLGASCLIVSRKSRSK